jgi:hypothetical protein
MLRGKVIGVNAYVIKEERCQIDHLRVHLLKLKQEKQN